MAFLAAEGTSLLCGWSLYRRVLDRAQTLDMPPAAEADAVVVESGASVAVDVLANDADPEGGPLALLGASAEYGSARVEDGRVVYTAATGFDGLDTVAYVAGDAAGNRSLGTLTVTVQAATGFGIADVGDGTSEISALSSGLLEIAVSGGTGFDGVYVVDPADLETGPVSLAPPRIVSDGTPEVGETVTVTPGLWIYDAAAGAPAIAWQWQADAGGAFADIAGATGASRVLAGGEAGGALRVVESATQSLGSRSHLSAPLAIAAIVVPPPPPPPPALAGAVADGVSTASVAPAAMAPAREAMVFFSVVPAALGARMRVMSMDGSNIRFMIEGNGSFLCRWIAGGTYSFSGGSVAAGQRVNFLSSWTAASATESRLRAWVQVDGTWSQIANQLCPTASDLALDRRAIGLVSDFAGNDRFRGTIYRGAFWSGAAGALPDISDAATRSLFAAADGSAAAPAAARGFGRLEIDFAGPLADWNAGRHAGMLGPFAVTGEFK